MVEDQGARRDVPVRVGVVHLGVRRHRGVPHLAVAEAPADGGPCTRPPGAPSQARRRRGFRRWPRWTERRRALIYTLATSTVSATTVEWPLTMNDTSRCSNSGPHRFLSVF